MIKQALEYLMEEMSIPFVKVLGNGEIYSDRPLHRISYNPKAEPIEMNTLSSLIDYIKSKIDQFGCDMIIHVQSPTHIEMYSDLDLEHKREFMVKVNANVPDFRFNHFIDHESFCINLQSKFIDAPGTDRSLILKFAGTVESGTVSEYGDDGVTQKATVKTGIASKGEAIVPNPVLLQPYRTFVEVEQPFSQFIFRMKQDNYGEIQCALFEADGGAWKNEAMKSIKEYLQNQLEGIEGYIVIS